MIAVSHDAARSSAPGNGCRGHRAGNLPEVWRRMGEIVDDLDGILRGFPPPRLAAAEYDGAGERRAAPFEACRLVAHPVNAFCHASRTLPVYVHLKGLAVWL